MPADNRANLTVATARRAADTRERARAALRRLDQTGAAVTFTAVAAAANISRSWLYRHPDLRAEITRLRDIHRPTAGANMPAAQRASHVSLQRRLETALEANRALRAENQKVRDEIAALLGEQRALNTGLRARDPRSIGPCS